MNYGYYGEYNKCMHDHGSRLLEVGHDKPLALRVQGSLANFHLGCMYILL